MHLENLGTITEHDILRSFQFDGVVEFLCFEGHFTHRCGESSAAGVAV